MVLTSRNKDGVKNVSQFQIKANGLVAPPPPLSMKVAGLAAWKMFTQIDEGHERKSGGLGMKRSEAD